MPRSSVDPAPEIVSLGPDHAIAVWKVFLLQIWRTGTPLEAAHKVRAAAKQLAAKRLGALATVVVVEPAASMPDADARKEIAGMVDDQAKRMVAAALVHEGRGFRAAAVRAVMTGMMSMARHPFPHEVVATVTEACTWLAREKL